jgi:hypothetical protein
MCIVIIQGETGYSEFVNLGEMMKAAVRIRLGAQRYVGVRKAITVEWT